LGRRLYLFQHLQRLGNGGDHNRQNILLMVSIVPIRFLIWSRNGFEISIPKLGAQKQVCGGGAYAEGIGFAIGIDRLVLAKMGL
jgi:hypothetical protein